MNLQLFAEDVTPLEDDISIAEQANKLLKEKEKEINDLKLKLAKEKLYSQVDTDVEPELTREDCLNTINNHKACNYDVIESVLGIVDYSKACGKGNPLGQNGEEVYDFLKEVISDCDGDKSRFTAIYQSKLGNDDSSISMAYNKSKYNGNKNMGGN